MKRKPYIISLGLLLLLLAACKTEERNEPQGIRPVEEMKYQQEVIENVQESDRQLEEQLGEIPFE